MQLLVITILLGVVLLGLSAIDMRSTRLPDIVTLPLAALGLVWTWSATPEALGYHAVAALVGMLSFAGIAWAFRMLRGVDGLGLGDAKLLGAVGAWLGPFWLAPVVFASSVTALLSWMVWKPNASAISGRAVIPYGPFLSGAFFVAWCFTSFVWQP